jgi:sigma-B regulation protein RsbU (phosphoserine phosphatase)
VRRTYRAALWRVRNRLLLTSVLFGIVPILLIALLLSLAVRIVLGQYMSAAVRQALDSEIAATATIARLVARTASGLTADDPATAIARLDEVRQQAPLVKLVVRDGTRTFTLPETTELETIPDWMAPDFKGPIESDRRYFIAASAVDSDVRVLAYQRLDGDALSRLTSGDVAATIVPTSDLEGSDPDADIQIELGSGRSFIRRNGVEQVLEVSTTSVPAPHGFLDEVVEWLLPMDIQSASGRGVSVIVALASTRSLVLSRLFSSLGPAALQIAIVMSALALVLLVVEIISLTWSVRLTRTITRSVHELYEATRQVAAGNLSHRAPLRGFDQLTELSGSFNTMTERIQQLLVDVKEKEKIEAELAIARRVQLELFPKSLPSLSSLELAGVCMPSRFVSGDYYDFVPLDGRWTAIVLGDVSGKGIGAALVMATLQAALHAQLRFVGSMNSAGEEKDPSTARLTERLSQQLYENTPGEKYATLFSSLYDDGSGRLVYTNAGHLPPILIRGGRASALETSGMVVGLMPIFSYEQQTVELEDNDLLAIFSDGVTEAENAAGEQFETVRLSELLAAHSSLPLEELLKTVTDHLTAWIHVPEARDDITIVLVRKRPAAAQS